MKFKLLFIILFILLQLQSLFAKEKFKYKVVKPKKKCVITYESTFSVTGFMTFVVVAMTSVANVITNINNNNDNNNNNNNQDNINNNNQMSSSADAENMGNARSLPHDAFCYVAKNEAHKGTLENVMTSILGFLLLDYVPSLKHEIVLKIMENPLSNCVK